MVVPNTRRLLSENPADVDEWLNLVASRWNKKTSKKPGRKRGKEKGPEYVENIATFDIETTSFKKDLENLGIMYVWMMDVCEVVIYGRTIEQFVYILECLDDRFNLRADNKILPIFVHKLDFEWSFIYPYFDWDDGFALEIRKPVRVKTGPFEFRDTLVLFGTKLANIELHMHTAAKLVGDLDYEKVRTPETPLTDKEWEYCYQDVNVLSLAVREKLCDNNDTLATMPMTRTGYVRREVRRRMSSDRDASLLVSSLTMTPEVYERLRLLYQGGFTHTGNYASCKVHHNVDSHDFRSSYPAVIVSEKYPMTTFQAVAPSDFGGYLANSDDWAMMVKVQLNGLKEQFVFEHPLSLSHCACVNPHVDNGRIVSADELTTWLDENDWATVSKAYTWDSGFIQELWVARKDYLPKPIIEYMMECYKAKTELKGDASRLVYYNLAKEVCNSIYGMMVTDPIRDSIVLNSGRWHIRKSKLDDQLDKYNASNSRCLYYAWGVWVTSYARRNLWRGIFEYAEDYCYSDTDSIKGKMNPQHQAWIDGYNVEITQKVKSCLNHYGLDPALAEPVSPKAGPCPIGQWDHDGTYKRFKALGAKRYMYECDDHDRIHTTVAGLGKKEEYIEGKPDNRPPRLPDLLKKISDDPFDAFKDELEVPAEYTGKLTHTYFDEPASGTLVDYLGHPYDYTVLSGTHLGPQSYNLTMSKEYIEHLMGIGIIPVYA